MYPGRTSRNEANRPYSISELMTPMRALNLVCVHACNHSAFGMVTARPDASYGRLPRRAM